MSVTIEVTRAVKRVEAVVKLSRPNAVRIDEVLPDGVAGEAGLLAGDVVVRYGGRRIRSIAEMKEAIGGAAGGPIPIEVLRDGRPVTLTVPPGRLGVNLAEIRIEERLSAHGQRGQKQGWGSPTRS